MSSPVPIVIPDPATLLKRGTSDRGSARSRRRCPPLNRVLVTGLMMNRVSPAPLPIIYQTPEQRFDAELTTLREP